MRNLWRGAAAAALLSGTLAACASPHYPISETQTPGPPPLSAPKPKYPIDADLAARPTPAAAPAPVPAPAPPPTPAPVAQVESQALPPATAQGASPPADPPAQAAPSPAAPSATAAGAPTAASSPADPPSTTDAALSAPAPAAPAPVPPASTTANPAPAAASPASATAPAAPDPQLSLTPRMVVHDQSAPAASPPTASFAPGRLATAPVPERRAEAGGGAIAGRVVDYSEVFENYEVRRGDHIDELARNFNTTRDVLLDANHIRHPFVIHPGEILKVPVSKAYVAENGDTLGGVARRFGVEAGELAQMNHIPARATLFAGEKIGLPSSMRDHGPLRARAPEYASATPRWTAPSQTPTSQAPTSQTPTTQTPGYYAHSGLAPERPASFASAPVTATPPATIGLSDAQIADAARGRFVWPVRGDISAKFGPSGIGQRNDGVDIKAAQGTPVKAAAAGEVVYAGDQVPGFGNLVLVKHADGWVTAYAHLETVDVQMKQAVAQGQALGTVGESGGLTEPQLHFEVRYAPTPADKAKPVDPVLVLPAAG